MEEKKDIVAFLAKSYLWIGMILSGIMAKISLDVLGGRKLTRAQWIAVVGISVFGGIISNEWCTSNGWDDQRGWIVSLSALFSERICIWIGRNMNEILRTILLRNTRKEE